MKKSPLITYHVFETAPRPETGAYNISWPPAPDLVEASDQIIWSECNNKFINMTENEPAP
jgi:hypothetical protein